MLGLRASLLGSAVCCIRHLLILFLVVAVQDIILRVIQDLAFDPDFVGCVRARVKVERVLVQGRALPRLILNSVGNPDSHRVLPLDIAIDGVLDVESLAHHGIVQLLLHLPQILILLYGISNNQVLNSVGHVAVCGLSGSALG